MPVKISALPALVTPALSDLYATVQAGVTYKGTLQQILDLYQTTIVTPSNGGILYTDATEVQLLAPTATANQMLQSGANSAPHWSTPTYPSASGTAGKLLRSDGTNIAYTTLTFPDNLAQNAVLFGNVANNLGPITAVNSAVFVTTAAGVPGWSATMTDGQLIIGDTSGTPVAASLTAGANITITPGAGTISISSTGGATSLEVQEDAFNIGIDTGAADAYVVTTSPATDLRIDGARVSFTPDNNNTIGTPTINLNAVGLVNINLINGGVLLPGDLNTNAVANLQYSNAASVWVLLNPRVSVQTYYLSDAGGTADALVATLPPSIIAYTNGLTIDLSPTNDNTGAATLNAGFGALAIVKAGQAALIAGDIKQDTNAIVIYSAGHNNFQLLNPQATVTLSPLTTKGDVYTYSTVNDRLPVGLNQQLLYSDSAAATGNKWDYTYQPINASDSRFFDFTGSTIGGQEETVVSLVTGAGAANTKSHATYTDGTKWGVFSMDTGTTTTGAAGFGCIAGASAGSNYSLYIGSGQVIFELIHLGVTAVSDGTETYDIIVGFFDGPINTHPPGNGIYFTYTHSVNSGNWVGNCKDAGGTSTTNGATGPGSAAAFQRLKIVVNAAATSVSFYINDALMGSAITGNIPTATLLQCGVSISKSAGTTSRGFIVDAAYYRKDFSTPR